MGRELLTSTTFSLQRSKSRTLYTFDRLRGVPRSEGGQAGPWACGCSSSPRHRSSGCSSLWDLRCQRQMNCLPLAEAGPLLVKWNSVDPRLMKPLPFMGIIIGILILRPLTGRGFINHGSTCRFWGILSLLGGCVCRRPLLGGPWGLVSTYNLGL